MAYILVTIGLWTLFFVLVPRQERRKYYPTFLFSALLGVISDLYGVINKQWYYSGPVVGGLSLWSNLGIAPAESGLFIYFFPINNKHIVKIGYFALWSLGNAACEWFFVLVGWIGYIHWNPTRAAIFYGFFWWGVWGQEYWFNATGRLNGMRR
jgi:hypothetical protein